MDLSSLNASFGADLSGLTAGLAAGLSHLTSFVSTAGQLATRAGEQLNNFGAGAAAAGRKAADDLASGFSTVNGRIAASYKELDAQQKAFSDGVGRSLTDMKSLGGSLSTYVSLPITAFGVAAVVSAGKIEALTKGLQSMAQQDLKAEGVTGLSALGVAADRTQAELLKLREVAALPGLGFAEAIQGETRLRAVGVSAEASRAALLAFGNAIATTGGGASELARVTTQLSQLASKGKVLSQDLRPIIEAAPAVATALQTLYGTVDSQDISAQLEKQGKSSIDFIATLTTELGKLPSVSGGLANAFENLSDSAEIGLAKVGASIAKSLNIEGVTESLGNSITGLADAFTDLPPGVQTAIIALAGVVAATGPVLAGVATLGLALPALKAGFVAVGAGVEALEVGLTVLAGPVGIAIAAVAALGAAAYYLATANDRALDSFTEQASAANELTTNISPLLDRYDELASKSNLSAAEQEELASIMGKVAGAVPAATTAIDQYGQTTKISTDRARELIDAQNELTRAKAANAIDAQRQKLQELGTQYEVVKKQVEEFNRTGSIKVAVFDSGGGAIESYGAGSKAVLDLQENAAKLNLELLKQQQVVGNLDNVLKGYKSGLEDVNKTLLDTAELESKFFGGSTVKTDSLDSLRDKLKEIKKDYDGLSINNPFRAELVAQYKAIEAQIAKFDGLAKAGHKAADELSKAFADVKAKLNGVDVRVKIGTEGSFDALEDKINVLQEGIKKITDLNVKVNDSRLIALNTQLTGLIAKRQKLDAEFGRQLKPLVITTDVDTAVLDRVEKNLAEQERTLKIKLALDGDLSAFNQAVAQAKTNAVQQLADAQVSPANPRAQQIATDANNAKVKDMDSSSIKEYNAAITEAILNEKLFGQSFNEPGAKADALAARIKNLYAEINKTTDPDFAAKLQEQVDKALPALEKLKQAAKWDDVQNQIGQAAGEAIAQTAELLGTQIGNVISGNATAGEALKATFSGVLGIFGGFLVKLGEALVVYGGLMLAADILGSNPLTAPAAIAIGLAAIVAGSVLSAISSSGPSGGGGGGGSSYTPTASTGATGTSATSNTNSVKVEVTFQPVELRADGPTLRSVMNVDSYRLVNTK